jgi:two-component system response regulator ResD
MKKILVINNDFDTMTLLKSWLERKRYRVKFTGSRQEVPRLMTSFKPELVIVDVMQMDVADDLKTSKKTNAVPVLLMTGYTMRQMRTQTTADDMIEKPFNLPLLEKKIERLIGQSI